MVVTALRLDGLDDDRSNRLGEVSSRQRFSSAAFSEANSLRGYLRAGNGACGQSKAGMSSL
jgi:hypothetical protein